MPNAENDAGLICACSTPGYTHSATQHTPRVLTRVLTRSTVEHMKETHTPPRSIRVSDEVWNAAKAAAERREETVTDAVVRFLTHYGEAANLSANEAHCAICDRVCRITDRGTPYRHKHDGAWCNGSAILAQGQAYKAADQ